MGRTTVKASLVASFSTMKYSRIMAMGAMMGSSWRAMKKVALDTPPVLRATLYTIMPYTMMMAIMMVYTMFCSLVWGIVFSFSCGES